MFLKGQELTLKKYVDCSKCNVIDGHNMRVAGIATISWLQKYAYSTFPLLLASYTRF